MRPSLLALCVLLLSACSDGKPPHYYVMCMATDPNNWSLLTLYKDKNGYIMSCTYQSPDKQQSYTVTCDEEGCE